MGVARRPMAPALRGWSLLVGWTTVAAGSRQSATGEDCERRGQLAPRRARCRSSRHRPPTRRIRGPWWDRERNPSLRPGEGDHKLGPLRLHGSRTGPAGLDGSLAVASTESRLNTLAADLFDLLPTVRALLAAGPVEAARVGRAQPPTACEVLRVLRGT